MFVRLGLFLGASVLGASPAFAEEYLVRSQAEYAKAAKQVLAGDVIVLANGEWRDFEIVLTGKGTSLKPITLAGEEAGKVFITGKSNLRLGGEHMLVTGLVFRDGHSPTGEVLSFRRNKEDLARNSRMSGIVIDNFSKPDRYESDYWVGMYGSNNRFDHNHLVGKTNKGVTLAVRLDSEASRNNNHRIDHNYFGHRPVLGSNGGETLRIGTSQYSMFVSGSIIENNYFERCDGEVEIISIKSGGNVVRGNVFDASQGAVTLRHGDGNLIERNVFFGRGKDHTGGIRVINADQTVRGNYMEGLRGTGFASALTVMNGVPDSPVNRYVQVSDARIEHNSILDSARITLGAGSDEERSAVPVDSRFAHNLLSAAGSGTFIEVDDDITGIEFAHNRLIDGQVHSALPSLRPVAADLKRAPNGLLYPVDPALASIGAPRDLDPVRRDATGPDWYPKPDADTAFGSGGIIPVKPGDDTIEAALAGAGAGDTLTLAAGEYSVSKTIPVGFALTLAGPRGDDKVASISFSRPSLFEMTEGGSLRLQDLFITGRDAPDNVGNNVLRTSAAPIRGNFTIEFDRVTVNELTVNRNFDVIVIGTGAFADMISIRDSAFSDISGTVVRADAETDDYGRYGTEYVSIAGSSFRDVGKGVATIYRGGTDESTFGPHFRLTASSIDDAGGPQSPAVLLHGVQQTLISGNDFAASGPLKIVHTVGTPQTVISGNRFDSADPVIAEERDFPGEPRLIMADNTMPQITLFERPAR